VRRNLWNEDYTPDPNAGFARWVLAFGTFGVPQAAAPIAFSLLALSLTGSADHGSWVVLAMTLAQIAGAVPVARAGRGHPLVRYTRLLMIVRTGALLAATVLAAAGATLWAIALAAGCAGLVNGAAHGCLRAVLNHLVGPGQIPRALGLGATLNEVTFASSPVIVSVIGAYSPVAAIGAIAVLGTVPLFLVPSVQAPPATASTVSSRTLLRPGILLWLFCCLATSASTAGVEVGAVSLALRFSLAPAAGALFALVLCLASISGGLWVTARNRQAQPRAVIAYLLGTSVGAVFVWGGWTLVTTLVGAVLIGFFIPVLGTHYSLVLDRLAPPQLRAEAFSLLRTASAVGVIATSGVLAIAGLDWALGVCAGLVVVATVLVAVSGRRPPNTSA
jgi:DHA1 family inner membrane transport protein